MMVPPALVVPARRISAQDIESYASLTGDYNPLHLDAEFAARTHFGHPIVYGTLLLVPIWEVLAHEFGGPALEGARAAVKFKRPIKVGSLLQIDGLLLETDAESTTYRFVVRDGHGGIAVDVHVILAVAGP
jgi:acyl dehydratase